MDMTGFSNNEDTPFEQVLSSGEIRFVWRKGNTQ